MKRVAFFVLLAVIGCTREPSTSEVLRIADEAEGYCRNQNASFAVYEKCLVWAVSRSPMLNSGPHVDLVNQYLAGVRMASRAVAATEVSEEAAYWASAAYYSQLRDIYIQRRQAVENARDLRIAIFAQQMQAFSRAYRPLPNVPPPPPAQITPFTCTQMGVFFSCR